MSKIKYPSFDTLKKDYQDSLEKHREFVDKLLKWNSALEADYKINTAKGRSKIQPKLVRTIAEYRYPAIEEVFLSNNELFKIEPRTFADVKSAKQNEAIINYQWKNVVNRTSFINEAVRSFVDYGNVFVKISWLFKNKVIKDKVRRPIYLSPEESFNKIMEGVEQGKITQEEADILIRSGKLIKKGYEDVEIERIEEIENKPVYEVCRPEDIIIDPTATDVKDAQFIIHKFETSFGSLKSLERIKLKDGRVIGIYKNLSELRNKIVNSDYEDYQYEIDDDGMLKENVEFKFKDIARKKIQVIEYWGYWDFTGDGVLEPFVATWSNDVLIRLEKSPYPFDELPFVQAKYMPRFKKAYGEPDSEIIEENQKSLGSMTRALHDITSDLAVNQTFIASNFFSSPLQRKNYEEGKTVYFTPGLDPRVNIWQKDVKPIPPSVFQSIEFNRNQSFEFTGITPQSGQNLSGSAMSNTQAKNTLTLSQKKELEIIRRFAEMIKDIGKKTVEMNAIFLPEDYVVRITDEEFIKIDKKNLKGSFDFSVEISTPEKDNDTAQKLNILMQTNAAHMDPELSKVIYAKIAELWRQPDLAKKIRDYKPEPDQLQLINAQLELENKKLSNQLLKMEIAKIAKDIESEDSKIEERESRIAKHLLADSDEKEAKAKKLKAETVKILNEVKTLEPRLEIEKQKLEADIAKTQLNLSAKTAKDKTVLKLEEENRRLKEELASLYNQLKQNSDKIKMEKDKPTVAESEIYKTTAKLLQSLEDNDDVSSRI